MQTNNKLQRVLSAIAGTTLIVVLVSVATTSSTQSQVPVIDPAHIGVSSSNLAANSTETAKSTVLDGLLWAVAKQGANEIMQQTINWVNSGFDGEPAFVTNPESFLRDIGENQFRDVVDTYKDVSDQYFSSDVARILVNNLESGFVINYNLEEVVGGQDNAQSLSKGDFSSGGWNGFYAMTQNPDNNFYGSVIQTSEAASGVAEEKRNVEEQVLAWGDGFRSTVEDAAQSGINEITLPGTVIKDRLNETLGTPLRQLEIADEAQELFQALAQQLTSKLMGDVGLSGL